MSLARSACTGTTIAHTCETDSVFEQSKIAFPRSHNILLQGFILCGHAQSPPARGPYTCSSSLWYSTSQGLHQTGPFSLVWVQLKCFIHEEPFLWTLNPKQHSHSTLLQSLSVMVPALLFPWHSLKSGIALFIGFTPWLASSAWERRLVTCSSHSSWYIFLKVCWMSEREFKAVYRNSLSPGRPGASLLGGLRATKGKRES